MSLAGWVFRGNPGQLHLLTLRRRSRSGVKWSATGGATVDDEPPKAPAFNPSERAPSVIARAPLTWRSWGVVVLVGVPLLAALVVGLKVVNLEYSVPYIGATILAAWVAGRMAGIHGAGRWFLAWLLIFSLFNLLSLLLYFYAVANWGAAPP